MLFGDAEPEKETAPAVSPMGETGEVPDLSSTPVNGDTSIVPIPAGTAADAIASMTGAATASTAATASSVEEAIATPIPEPPLAFGDLSELMGETKKPEVKEEAKVEDDLGKTKVVPFVNTFDKAADALDKQLAENEKKDIEDKKALENTAENAIDKILEAIPEETPAVPVVPEAREVIPQAPAAPSDEPFVAVKNADNPFFKAAQKAQAEAKKYAMEQEAAGITAKAQAEAEAIRLKGEAEAAAMDKKAEALKKYGKAAMAQMAIEILPKVAAEVAKPLGTIDKVTIFGGGNGSGMSSMSDNVPLVMAKTIQTIKEATGVDIAEIMRAESYEAKTTKNVNVTGMTEKEVREAVGAAAMAEAIPAK